MQKWWSYIAQCIQCGAQEARVEGFSCTITRVLGGTSGVRLGIDQGGWKKIEGQFCK